MKIYGTVGAVICSLLAVAASSCEKADKVERFPEGTSMIRMMNEENGKTKLGNSDLYITSSGNFRSERFPIMDCGATDGIGGIGLPDFMNMAPEVAVIPGHGYVVCSSDDVYAFPSRKWAIAENAQVYRFYADSWITDDKGNAVGANVYFLLGTPPGRGNMPKMNSSTEQLTWEDRNNKSREISMELPSEDIEAQITSDDKNGILDYATRGRTLTFRLSHSPASYEVGNYKVRVRSGRVYTEIVIPVDYPY